MIISNRSRTHCDLSVSLALFFVVVFSSDQYQISDVNDKTG